VSFHCVCGCVCVCVCVCVQVHKCTARAYHMRAYMSTFPHTYQVQKHLEALPSRAPTHLHLPAHARTQVRAHARTHTTHTHSLSLSLTHERTHQGMHAHTHTHARAPAHRRHQGLSKPQTLIRQHEALSPKPESLNREP